MANNKYFKVETVEFQNGDSTLARPLVIKKYRVFMDVFAEYNDMLQRQYKGIALIASEIEAKKEAKEEFDEDAYFKERSAEYITESDASYVDTLIRGTVVALKTWGVKTESEGNITVDQDYVEDNLDLHEMTKICEIAGSMELGDISGDVEGKAKAPVA